MPQTDNLTEAALALLAEASNNGEGVLLCEYDSIKRWRVAQGLEKRGLLSGKRVITGTVAFTLTNAGRDQIAAA